jgi:hypothetical protein
MDHEYYPYYFTEKPPKDVDLFDALFEAVVNVARRLAEAFNPSPILPR